MESAADALKNHDASSYSNYNQSFHYEIWTAAGNEKMRHMLSELWNGLSMGVRSTEEEYAVKSLEEHKEILDALERRDVTLAGKAMSEPFISVDAKKPETVGTTVVDDSKRSELDLPPWIRSTKK